MFAYREIFLLQLADDKDCICCAFASLPGTSPNCDSSIVTTCPMRLSAILSVFFIACTVNFSPLKLPWSRAYHPFPCKGRLNEALPPVNGDLPISNDCYGEVTVCLFELMLYVHGKQLRSCRDGNLSYPNCSWANLPEAGYQY